MPYIVDSQGVKYRCQFLSEGLIAEVFELEPIHSRNIKIPKSIIVDRPLRASDRPHSGLNCFLYEGEYQVISISYNAFGDTDSVESVILPDGLKEIEDSAFDNCTSLISVKIPDSVVKIGAEAFYGCKNLRSIVLPDNLELIDSYTFYGCSNLEYVKIGDYTQKIDKTAFRNCPRLKEVVFRSYDGRKNWADCHRELREAVPNLVIHDVYDNNDRCQASPSSKTLYDSGCQSGNVANRQSKQRPDDAGSRATQPYRSKTQGSASSRNQQSGCYIATAVYGNYDCPEVWTLRRYRDNVLDNTWYGRLFISGYYAISPILVRWFGKTDWFRNLFFKPLSRWVAILNKRGFENTPYNDKY